MAITRLTQLGFESNGSGSLMELSSYSGSEIQLSSTVKKTGNYSLRFASTNTHYARCSLPATFQARFGMHLRLGGMYTGSDATFFYALNDVGTTLFSLDCTSSAVRLNVGGTLRASTPSSFPWPDFIHVGIDAKIASSGGWVNVYFDGTLVMSFSGNTGTTAMVQIGFGSRTALALVTSWVDDIIIDDTTGESAAAPVPDYRFIALPANNNGYYSQWTGSDGNNIDNYELVDEQPHDGDSTYVYADALNERDTYALTDISLPSGFIVSAVIPYAYARKTSAGVATKLAFALRQNNTDWTSADLNLPTSYQYLSARAPTAPDGSNWTESKVNSCEAGAVGRGDF